MIWPEFEDEHENVIIQSDRPVPKEGIARMWVIMPQMRPFHRDKITIGLKGFLWRALAKLLNVK